MGPNPGHSNRDQRLRLTGEVAEWLKAPLSKSGISQGIVGSNPTLSATLVLYEVR